ncbi:MAG: flavodoxin-dependent (E)-4-hydroxy-3-methylbut-2-enyl-diphosphate synthase, partial [Syntrophales bacterium LBB04]|nr:flavodoxin-dependent (E)-4-hydroxy-3-methylbut-2-enyl-diphosphate synthase [Syntrophales bacterium LBB04]
MIPVIQRKKTKPVYLGGIKIGGGAPVSVQSMTSSDTRGIKATVEQIHELEEAGCGIVRVAVPA